MEDEKLLAKSLCDLLESKGFETEAVYNGKIWAESSDGINTFHVRLTLVNKEIKDYIYD